MAEFEVKTHSVIIAPHPDADRLEIARLEGQDYNCVVAKGAHKTGDTVAYIPEASIVPDPLIEEMGLTGRLAGSKHNRVKAVRLRGVLSQGLVYAMPDRQLGDDVTDELGIVKYEPPIPRNMAGNITQAKKFIEFGIENIKKYPDLFAEGDAVHITEKLHGSWCLMGRYEGEVVVSSLGLNKKGLALAIDDENRHRNLYVQQYVKHQEIFDAMASTLDGDFFILGEVFGSGVQDLKYGLPNPEFRVFDIWHDGKYQEWDFIESWKWETVPVLYKGGFDRSIVDDLTDGLTTIGDGEHIREGVVVRGIPSKINPYTGMRNILKSVSADYLTRRGGTELT